MVYELYLNKAVLKYSHQKEKTVKFSDKKKRASKLVRNKIVTFTYEHTIENPKDATKKIIRNKQIKYRIRKSIYTNALHLYIQIMN